MLGPLGNYAIAQSLVQTPGWKPLEAEENEMLPGGGRGGGGFSMGFGGGEYRGRIGADTSNLPPSQRGLYENSAPSLEAIQGAYDANLARGMTHQEIMKLFNEQADRDAKFWAEGFAKDPNFSQTLYDKSQAIVAKPYGTTAASGKAYAQKLKTQQKNKSLLAASRGAFNQPFKAKGYGPWSGGIVKTKAPLALNSRTGRTFGPAGRGW
jgi:hypothetical protein